jgi:hypothetical protein
MYGLKKFRGMQHIDGFGASEIVISIALDMPLWCVVNHWRRVWSTDNILCDSTGGKSK